MIRRRRLRAKAGELRVGYGRIERHDQESLIYAWGDGCSKSDASLLADAFEREPIIGDPKSFFDCIRGTPLIKDLEARGYDLSTLTLSIKKKSEAAPE